MGPTRDSLLLLTASLFLLASGGCGSQREDPSHTRIASQLETPTIDAKAPQSIQNETRQLSGITLESFREMLAERSGAEGWDCGHMEALSDSREVNCCVLEHLELGQPFHATFRAAAAGDSAITHGIAFDGDGNLSVYLFDSDPSGGGRLDNRTVLEDSCLQMELIEATCDSDNPRLPISCSNAEWGWFSRSNPGH